MSAPCQCQPPRPVLVEVMGVYDGAIYFECKTCGVRWHRFPEGHWLWKKAKPFVERDPQPARIGGTEA